VGGKKKESKKRERDHELRQANAEIIKNEKERKGRGAQGKIGTPGLQVGEGNKAKGVAKNT